MLRLHELPLPVLLVLVVGTMVALAVGAQIALRRIFKTSDLSKNNAVVGTSLSVVGIVYAVVLGFVVVITWEGHQTANRTAFDEVNAVGDLYRYAPMLGQPASAGLRAELRRYVDFEIDEEWPAIRRGASGAATEAKANRLVYAMIATLARAAPSAVRERELGLLQKMLDDRRATLFVNAGTVPGVLWLTLVLGSAVTLGMTFLVGTESFRVHLLLTAGATALIGIMFVLIIDLGGPVRGQSTAAQYWRDLRIVLHDQTLP